MRPDTSHATVQAAFRAALWAKTPPVGLIAPDPSEVPERFKIYRNNVFHSLTRTLAARFPVIERLVGAQFFAALARAYLASSPPQDPVLLNWGASFAPFLDRFPPVAHLPFLGDVARLEYARGQATHAADAAPITHDALHGEHLDALRVTLHPSVCLFQAVTPAVQIWHRHQPGHTCQPLKAGPDHALIARRPDFTVIVQPVDPGSFAILTCLQAGAPLGQAAQLADPTAALTQLLTHGLIVDVQKGPLA